MSNHQQQAPQFSGVVPATPGTFDFYSAARAGSRWVASGSTAGSQVFFRPVSEEPESTAATVRESYWSEGDIGGGGGGDDGDEDEDWESSDERYHHQRMLRDPPLPTRIPKEDRLSRVSPSGRGLSSEEMPQKPLCADQSADLQLVGIDRHSESQRM